MGSLTKFALITALGGGAAVAGCGPTVATGSSASSGAGGSSATTGTAGPTTSTSGSGASTSSSGTGGTVAQGHTDKVDLLLDIDNSRSMADKQQVLAEVLPDLVRSLVNPACVDPATGAPATQQPAGPADPCPDPTSKRLFAPVADLHIGIVTTSIGGHGSDSCPNSETFSCPAGAANTTNNDLGHLVTRLDPCAGGSVATYLGKGFLAWDPTGEHPADPNPNVHTSAIGTLAIDVATGAVTTQTPGIVPDLKDLVLGVGQIGCGYESQLESWYRFLVDPQPYQTITLNAQGLATPTGTDSVLLQQRKDFLRPSSLLAIVGLTDENDCSTKELGQFYFLNQQRDPANPNQNFHLPRPRAECATNPNDACCRSCGQDQTGCPADPTCTAGGGVIDAKSDDVNLRCWDTKRRFGIDFLYPVDRYVVGLTQPSVPDRMGNLVPNPIFSDLDPTDGDSTVRDPSLVLMTYLVGVPWQDLARDPTDLKKGFKGPAELAKNDAAGHTTWDYVLGDPASFVKPLDPHMIEASGPRTGTDPITGAALAPPSKVSLGQPGTWPDPLNGHEYTTGTNQGVQVAPDDLEYACIFQLPTPRDCSDPNVVACDCTDPKNDSPLCADNGAKGRTLQARAKGYPGLRELSLIKALGPQGLVGSICPAQVSDLNAADFGYRPIITALAGTVSGALPKAP